MSGSPSDDPVGGQRPPNPFLERAKAEAARYGSDLWIFVRELLQNARDAGARHVVITTGGDGAIEWVSCRDDGDGMSFDHARRYLFTLYASSKEGGGKQTAGQFGVGFWSILRFDPSVITVRSWPKKGGPWELSLDGRLTRASGGEDPPAATAKNGTEVLLTRPAGDGHLARRVFDAVWQSSRYLSRRDDPSRPITLTVDGKSANAPFELPAPSASFRRGALRGVVGLGKEARVELFSKGLRVRSAPMLDDLLSASGRASDASRVSFPELEDGLAPQALLENPEIELLLSRSDVRGSKSLERTVKTAHRELERLIERQLASSRPPSFGRRILDVLSAVPPAASVAVVAAAVAVLVLATRPEERASSDAAPPSSGAGLSSGISSSTTYQDLASAYGGPQADTLERASPPIALRYAPADRPLHFTALVVESLEGSGRPTLARDALVVYESATCSGSACVTVELGVDAPEGTLRLPVPAGHRLDPKSVRFEGEGPKLILGSSDAGEPVLVTAAPLKGVVRYVTGPAPAPRKRPKRRLPELPPEMERAAVRLSARSGVERVAAAMKWVQEHVRYSVEPATARDHGNAIARGEPFLQRTLEIGAGDCDVQNGMLAQLLQAAGTDARLVVGYLGVNGGAQPWLHAWVEWREPGGPWRVADASEGAPPPRVAAIAPVAPAAGAPAVTAPRTTAGEGTRASPPAVAAPSRPRRALPVGARGIGLAIACSIFVGGLGLALAEGTRRSTRLDPKHDLSKLLRGALVQPDAFRHVPSLFHRPLIPLSGGGQCALAEAWVLASKSRLFATRQGSPLARAVRRAGATVLDTATREGAAVAESLGAIDLDQWDSNLRATRSSPLLDALTAELAREGEDWRLRNGGAALEVLDIPVGRGRVRRWVIVPFGAPFFEEAVRRQPSRPKEALFRVADGILEKLDLPEEARKRLLARLAAAAVVEGA